MEWKIEIILEPQMSPSQKGRFFEDLIANVLAKQRYEIQQRVNLTGMEIDLLAKHKDRCHETAYIECKAKKSLTASDIQAFVFKVQHHKATHGFFLSTTGFQHQVAGLIKEIEEDSRYKGLYFWGPEKIVELLQDSGFIQPLPEVPNNTKRIILAFTYLGTFYILLFWKGTRTSCYRIFCAKTGKTLTDEKKLKFLQESLAEELKHKQHLPGSTEQTALEKGQPFATTMTTVEVVKISDDFSARICPQATLSDLDPQGVESLRRLWHKKTADEKYLYMPVESLLAEAELIYHNQHVTYGALILLGDNRSLGRLLAVNELIFEYRHREHSIQHQERHEFRRGFLAYFDELWSKINSRNDMTTLQQGFFIEELPSFDEEVIREAILNAVCHRDYDHRGVIFVRQYPHQIVVESPGSLPQGVNLQNIHKVHLPRNKRLAEVFQKIGLVERSGQGVDKILRKSIIQGKGKPKYEAEGLPFVKLTLQAKVQDIAFVQFLQKAVEEKGLQLSLEELLLLEQIRLGERVRAQEVSQLRKYGLIEKTGYGKGTKYILSRDYYSLASNRAGDTKTKGVDKESQKERILEFLSRNGKATRQEIETLFPNLRSNQVSHLLQTLRKEGKISFYGSKRKGYWKKM